MQTTLVIGSGVSYFSKIPGLNDITNSILTSEKIGKGTDTNYYLEGYWGYQIQENLNGYVSSCQKLLKLIEGKIDSFYEHISLDHSTNYEDIYYVVRQIHDSYLIEYENPATISLITELLSETGWSNKDFKDIVSESVRLIESLVWQLIDIPIETISQFDILTELIKYFELKTILSLNHDLVLDDWLKEKKIEYDDGFDYLDGKKLPEWYGFRKYGKKLKLCKAHGSIDWFEFRINKPKTYDNLVKIPRNHYAERINEIDNSFISPNSGKPSLLTGTFNKMLGYLAGIHEILFEELKSVISSSEIILISGYGFGDKGINTRLSNWLYQPHSHKMIIIHPDRNSLVML